MKISTGLVIAAMALTPAVSLAHPGPEGHLHGLDLPVLGFGPIIAALTIGLLAWRLGRHVLAVRARRDARPQGFSARPDA